jgi:septum site-determining protein MinC
MEALAEEEDQSEELFGTETMAELCARQGRLADAISIYQRLLDGETDPERQERMAERLYELTRAGSRVAVPAASTRRVPLPAAASPLPRGETRTTAEPSPPAAPPALSAPKMPLVVEQPVRSGQVVYAEDGDLIVLAPVNPGAQLMADGNIHVYGPLRGTAIAGAGGCAEARVFCQRMEAEVIGINGHFLTYEDIPPALVGKPAQVFLAGGACVIKPL